MADELLPASWRGIPFAVENVSTGGAGRRFAKHTYPGRDGVRLEDLGRRGRMYRFRGFILSNSVVYGGGPVAVQRELLLAAADQPGTGILVHPTLGILTVGCEDCSVSDDLAAGTIAAVEFSFLEDTQQSFLGVSASTITAVIGAAALVDGAASLAFTGARVSGIAGASASSQWTGSVMAGARDATALTNLASQLPGPYGRYFAGGNVGYLSSGAGSPYAADTTVSDLVASAVTARADIASAASTVASDFASLSAATSAQTAGDVQDLVGALQGACADPADALRIMAGLAAGPQTGVTGVDDLYRRAAVTAAARAATTYQPSSYDDAVQVQNSVTGLLDAEIDIAGDEGDDATYQALKGLRVAVVGDLKARGGALAPLKTFTFALSLPVLYLAERLYGDASRAAQLLAEADPVHPLFMPMSFAGLAE